MKRQRKSPKDRHEHRPSEGQVAAEAPLVTALPPGLASYGLPDLTPRELIILGCILFVGIALRLSAFSRSAVEHFDEGVYASNIYFDAPDYAYPMRRFYAPPLLPALIETGMLIGLPPNVAALLPSFLAGCGTIIALWWFGRSWFGPPVGIAAATLVAMSDFHVLYSATALTDVLLGLWLMLAVDAMGRSLVAGTLRVPSRRHGTRSVPTTDLRWAVVAGIYTALAWWTKYNGWLPLAIEGAALPLLWLLLRPPGKQLVAWLACFAVTALVAAALWSPYYFSLQSTGGYAPIAANHAKYVVGLAGWFGSATRQIANQYALGMGLSILGLGLAILLPALLDPRRAGEALWLNWKALGAMLGFSLLTAMFAVTFGAVIGVGRLILVNRKASRLELRWKAEMTVVSLLIAWWLGMLVATGLYTPYSRLALPLFLVTTIAGSLFWADYLDREAEESNRQADSRWGCLILILVLGYMSFFSTLLPHEDAANLSHDRRGLECIAREIRTFDIRREARAIYVFGEPALYFQLRAAGEEIVAPTQTIPAAAVTVNGKAIPTFLVVGPHALSDPAFRQQWRSAEKGWEEVAAYEYQPSAVVWLDLHDPRVPMAEDARERSRVRLYRLRP